MAEDDKPKLELPWATLLPLIAALAGIIVQFKPLVSTRPSVPSEKPVEVFADQDVDARLWQDPLLVAQKQKTVLDAEIAAKQVSETHVKRHQIAALNERVRSRGEEVQGGVLMLAVMLDAGPYLEHGESRLRARRAVLEGLSESGFVPVDGEHIGFVTTSWPPSAVYLPDSGPAAGDLVIPWEECRAVHRRPTIGPVGTERVFVLWLPAGNFDPYPLGRFAALIDQLAASIRDKVDVKLIGPANSAGLQAMLQEVRNWKPGASPERDATLDGATVISARATASDQALFYDLPPLRSETLSHRKERDASTSVAERIQSSVARGPREGLAFVRTISTDDVILGALRQELKLRGVRLGRDGPHTADHILVLTEWDNPYGRSLAATFAAEASRKPIREVPKEGDDDGSGVHSYRYLHGIDGRLPGDRMNAELGRQA